MHPNRSPFCFTIIFSSYSLCFPPPVSHSRTTLAEDQRHCHAAAVRSIIFVFFSSTYLLYLIAITGTPEVAITIQHRNSRQGSLHVYKTVLLLIEESIVVVVVVVRSTCLIQKLFPFFLTSVLLSSPTACGTAVHNLG